LKLSYFQHFFAKAFPFAWDCSTWNNLGGAGDLEQKQIPFGNDRQEKQGQEQMQRQRQQQKQTLRCAQDDKCL
jgi:hypothetical protein